MSNHVAATSQSMPVGRLQPPSQRPAPAQGIQRPPSERLADLVPMRSHTVQLNETLSGIAARFQSCKPADMDMDAWIQTIQMMNGLSDRHAVRAGQVLKIPELVTNGELLETTARAEGPYDPAAGVTFPSRTAPADQSQPLPPPPAAAPATKSSPATGTPNMSKAQPKLPDWRQEIVTAARDTLGTRYVWGGTNLDRGVDCSGLTQQLFDQAGIDLPRTSGEQFKTGGRAVSREDLQPGDLVFFRNGKGRIVHVGIYSGKNDKDQQLYISATNTKGVAEYTIDNWTAITKQRYAGARRFETPQPGQ